MNEQLQYHTNKKVVVFSFFDEDEDILKVQYAIRNAELINFLKQLEAAAIKKGGPVEVTSRVTLDPEKNKGKHPMTTTQMQENSAPTPGLGEIYKEVEKGAEGKLAKMWTPSVSLVRAMEKNGLPVDVYHLLYQPHKPQNGSRKLDTPKQNDDGSNNVLQEKGSGAIEEAIKKFSPATIVMREGVDIGSGHDFDDVYCALREYFEKFPFDLEKCKYYVHVSTGSSVMKTCMTILASERIVPAELVQTWREGDDGIGGIDFTNPSTAYDKYSKIERQRKKDQESNINALKQQIQTRNQKYNDLLKEIERVSMLDFTSPVLITGPTGAGKSTLVKHIYALRCDKFKYYRDQKHCNSFRQTNCALLDGTLVDSELFGHEKGAFTDAKEMKPGLIESAKGGILFLDEIGSLPPSTQAKLLTVLDGEEFRRVGAGGDSIKPDFQLFCGTNEDLIAKVKSGQFRRDLWERISTWRFDLPGLKDRREDIEPNIDYELGQFGKVQGNKAKRLSGKAREKFVSYLTDKDTSLEGNFRELHRMVWHMAVLAKGDEITSDEVQKEIDRHLEDTKASSTLDESNESGKPNNTLAKGENDFLHKLIGSPALKQMEKEFPLDLAQLRVVVEECRKAQNAAEAGKKLRPNTPNTSSAISQFFARAAFKKCGIELSFAAIKLLDSRKQLS